MNGFGKLTLFKMFIQNYCAGRRDGGVAWVCGNPLWAATVRSVAQRKTPPLLVTP